MTSIASASSLLSKPGDPSPIRIAILGAGVVAGGVVAVLRRNHDEIRRRAGRDIQVTAVAARDLNKARRSVGDTVALTTDFEGLVHRHDVDVVVELMGGIERAKTLVVAALEAGKHVVTANKALLAIHGTELFGLAQSKGLVLAFEAAVAGGIPIIKALREGLAANHIEGVAGIINGTTNFILTQMRAKGWTFDKALGEAQRLGFAEADPSFDVDGVDAAHKLTLLSALAFGVPVQFDKCHVEGIRQVQSVDVDYAGQLGYRVKLLGITRRTDRGIELRVHPTLVPDKNMIASVEGGMNAVLVQGDAVGASMYSGRGAGAEPTASSVIADLVDLTRLHSADPAHRVPPLAFQPEAITDTPILPISDIVCGHYLRMSVADQAGVLSQITGLMADHRISIDAVLQRQSQEHETQTDLVLITHPVLESRLLDALGRIEALPTVLAPVVRLRQEDLA